MALLPSPLLNVLVISVKSITYIKTLLKHEQKKRLLGWENTLPTKLKALVLLD